MSATPSRPDLLLTHGYFLAEDPKERLRIVQGLESAHWNRGRAAEILGISRSTLWRKMKELGIA